MDGEPVPGTFAAIAEIRALAQAVADSGHGLMEVIPAGFLGEDLVSPAKEMAWMIEISAATGCPITFLTGQNHVQPAWWREQLEICTRERQNRARVVPQMFCRAIGIMVCLQSKAHPFMNAPAYRSLEALPFAERVRRLQADPELRRRVALDGVNDILGGPSGFKQWSGVYPLGSPADYEPEPGASIEATARRQGRDPREVALDILLEADGTGFLHRPVLGYADGNLDPTYDLLRSPQTIPGGGDGGAHVATICDAGAPTFMLTHWVRDRQRGPRLPLEYIVKKQTHDAAQLYGLHDRGQLRPGMKADINLIDWHRLGCEPLHLLNDLPTGAQRLMQKSTGYVATLVAGEIIHRDGEDTGARPGGLIRGGRAFS
jgi:N-acyl-D-aspartate/D-glutamate deacylase